MSRIQRKWTPAIAAVIVGMGLAALAAQPVMLQAEAAGPGVSGSGIDHAPLQQGDYRVAASQQPGKKSPRPPTKGTGPGTGVDKGSGGAQGDRASHKDSVGAKTFIIDHPSDPRRYLVHATLEGPEGAVFYRGTARLEHGRAEVLLPSYFEGLTHRGDRTVILTNIDGFDRLAVEKQRDGKVANGRFIVISDNPNSAQEFDWEVKAARKDVPRLVVTPLKNEISVAGFGPYTFIARR